MNVVIGLFHKHASHCWTALFILLYLSCREGCFDVAIIWVTWSSRSVETAWPPKLMTTHFWHSEGCGCSRLGWGTQRWRRSPQLPSGTWQTSSPTQLDCKALEGWNKRRGKCVFQYLSNVYSTRIYFMRLCKERQEEEYLSAIIFCYHLFIWLTG